MAFTRDHGQCCLCLPLKLGVALVTMYILSYGCFCTVGMFKSTMSSSTSHSSSVTLQTSGYNLSFVRLATAIGIIGIPFAFFGFLGVYDDKPGWIRTFFRYLQIRLLCSIIVFIADIWTLRDCEGFSSTPGDQMILNTAMYELSSHGICKWGRLAYVVGFTLQTIVDVWMMFNTWKYTSQLELNPPYPIDFGYEKYDAAARWQFYEVCEPEELPMFQAGASYDATQQDPYKDKYAPDGTKGPAKIPFAPDGFRGPAYVRGTK